MIVRHFEFGRSASISRSNKLCAARCPTRLKRVALVDCQEHNAGVVSLTPLGEKVARAEGEAKARPVIERFMDDYLAFPEVLAVYDQADCAVHLSEMVEILQPKFPRWTAEAHFEYRASGCSHSVA